MADTFASRVSARPVPSVWPAPENACVRGIVTGQTVIVLDNGDVVCGRLMPKSVTVDPVRDPSGGLNYTVEWNIEMGKVGQKS